MFVKQPQSKVDCFNCALYCCICKDNKQRDSAAKSKILYCAEIVVKRKDQIYYIDPHRPTFADTLELFLVKIDFVLGCQPVATFQQRIVSMHLTLSLFRNTQKILRDISRELH